MKGTKDKVKRALARDWAETSSEKYDCYDIFFPLQTKAKKLNKNKTTTDKTKHSAVELFLLLHFSCVSIFSTYPREWFAIRLRLYSNKDSSPQIWISN